MVSVSSNGSLYAGTSLTLTCTVTLDPNVNNNERVHIEWSGLQSIPQDRYSVTDASRGSGGSYTSTLTISPLTDQDDDRGYTCTGTVTGGTNATDSDYVTISVIGKWIVFKGCFNPFLCTDAVRFVDKTYISVISWEPTNGARITYYRISYSNVDKMCFDDAKTIALDNSTMNFTLTMLEEGAGYGITLIALYEQHVIGNDTANVTTEPSGECQSHKRYLQ